MYSYRDSENRVPILQMDSELQHAQLELLSAHCATHQLRLHYSADDLARFGRRDTLRKSAEAARSLNEFYSSIEEKIPQAAAHPETLLPPAPDLIARAVGYVATYLRQQRDHYLPASRPLSHEHKDLMGSYFALTLLDHIRFVELQGQRLTPPDFYAEARALGFDNLPEITHMDSLTFVDVVVFNEVLSERSLFHALVHAVQFQILGVERYTELFVQSFLRTRTHFTVPLEAHAFALTSKFLRPSREKFCVEDYVHRWVNDDRY
jgi:hypothetical protein